MKEKRERKRLKTGSLAAPRRSRCGNVGRTTEPRRLSFPLPSSEHPLVAHNDGGPRGFRALKVPTAPAMEKEEGGRAGGAEPLRARDKILCYINMQSPGRSCSAPIPAGAWSVLVRPAWLSGRLSIKCASAGMTIWGAAGGRPRQRHGPHWKLIGPVSILSFKPNLIVWLMKMNSLECRWI